MRGAKRSMCEDESGEKKVKVFLSVIALVIVQGQEILNDAQGDG